MRGMRGMAKGRQLCQMETHMKAFMKMESVMAMECTGNIRLNNVKFKCDTDDGLDLAFLILGNEKKKKHY